MRLEDWWIWYSKICEDFLFDPARDYLSSLELSTVLGEMSELPLRELIHGRNVNVIGNSPDLNSILDGTGPGINIVADSAISTFLLNREPPEIIVTDLDGDLGDIMRCYQAGTTLVIHAHGDNAEAVGSLNRYGLRRVIGTTQNIPLWNIHNFGGFTDGDRAAFLADHFGAGSIILVGFDFNNVNRMKTSDPIIKKRKLKWAERLLKNLSESRGSEFRTGDIMEI